ncbi:MAG: hypothetical protein GY794_22820, partial [bacterium]|nr:hypothetical protein [bacterium]
MVAATGTDVSGPVEYFFDETSGNPGGTDSGWQTSPSYTDTGLDAGTQYTYTVTMRDSALSLNVGTPSIPGYATTNALLNVLKNGSFEDNTALGGGTGLWSLNSVTIDYWSHQSNSADLFFAANNSGYGSNNTDGTYYLIASTIGASSGDLFTLTQDFDVTDGRTYIVLFDAGARAGNNATDYIDVSAGGESLTLEDA